MEEVLQSDAEQCQRSLRGRTPELARAAFTRLVARHQGTVGAVCLSITGDPTLSEDLTQETFVSAWRHIGGLSDPNRFAPWVCTIARNLSLKTKRGKAQATRPLGEPPRATSLALAETQNADPERRLADAERGGAVWDALASLPEHYREPLVLFYRQDLSAKEIAAQLGLRPATVDQRLHRARKMVRTSLERELRAELRRTDPTQRVLHRIAAVLPVLPLPSMPVKPAVLASLALGQLLMKKILIGSTAIGLLILLIWTESALSTSASTRHSAADDRGPSARTRSASANPNSLYSRRLDHTDPTDEKSTRLPTSEGKGPGTQTTSKHLLSRNGLRWTINLNGGASEIYEYRWPGSSTILSSGLNPEIDRTSRAAYERSKNDESRVISGRVLSGGSQPLANVMVLGGDVELHYAGRNEPYAAGHAGAKTDPQGYFELSYPWSGGLTIVAYDGTLWSQPAFVPEGADEGIELKFTGAGTLRGVVTKDGEPESADIKLTMTGAQTQPAPSLLLAAVAGVDGIFEFVSLPQGQYTVSAQAESGLEAGKTQPVSKPAQVAVNEVTQIELTLESGVFVVVSLEQTAPVATPAMVVFDLFEGHLEIDSLAALSTAQRGDRRHVQQMRNAASQDELGTAVEFPDVMPGPITLCGVVAEMDGDPRMGEEGHAVFDSTPRAMACEKLEATLDQPFVEVSLGPARALD